MEHSARYCKDERMEGTRVLTLKEGDLVEYNVILHLFSVVQFLKVFDIQYFI